MLVLIIVLAGATVGLEMHSSANAKTVAVTKSKPIIPKTVKTTTTGTTKTAVAAAPNMCASNSLSQNVVVSISQRHLWACSHTTSLYDSAVVTGMENLPADLTPVGTYHIYAKETNLYLNGSDSTGSWHDYVYYWMPWLDNQYGAYGFHDATWRPADAFGNISPYTSDASHGCVELPLATAKWLYGWVAVGTTVTIES
jgi:lipoprotein-anchoring transpeptidase ErfK/SrfK